MNKLVLSLSLVAGLLASPTWAGGLLHRCGGCSDPCTAAACGGFRAVGNCSGCGAAQAFAPSYAMSQPVYTAQAPISGGCQACGGTVVMQTSPVYSPAMSYAPAVTTVAPSMELADCGPVQSYKVVMEPEYFTETKVEYATEYQDEVRYRTNQVARQVPVEVQDYRTTTVMVDKTETKTVEYSVLVPQTSEKTVDVTETVPVWNEVSENYTVRVPHVVDVPEEYTVRVPQLNEEQFSYTVQIPQSQTISRTQLVTNSVPVVKTRTVQVSRPVTRMQTVTKDYGHWEVRVEEVAGSMQTCQPAATYSGQVVSGGCGSVGGGCGAVGVGCSGSAGGCSSYAGQCGSCGGCGRIRSYRGGCFTNSACRSCGGCGVVSSGCGQGGYQVASGSCGSVSGYSVESAVVYSQPVATTQTVSRRVWVPNVITEEVPVVENVMESQEVAYTSFEQQTTEVPYECTVLVYVPEERTGVRKVVNYVDETRTRNRKVVEYNEETRTRTRKVLSYEQKTRSITVPVVSYNTEKRTKEVSYTVRIPETKVEPITTTRFDTVTEDHVEQYSVRVPVSVPREVQVQSSRMVPKLVPITVYPCSGVVPSAPAAPGVMIGPSGCNNCGQVPTMAPQILMHAPACSNCGGGTCSGTCQF
ncbi:MAG: hypothetical protein KDB03_10690 [Planctomycetales bacterium]|nr:hypothetical protein [Planctomycetales bacterium]